VIDGLILFWVGGVILLLAFHYGSYAMRCIEARKHDAKNS
jgi:hypothetical protein